MDVVMSFIAILEDTIVPMVKVRSFPYQKPWVGGSIRAAVNARTAAYNSSLVFGNMDEYKAASYGLRCVVKDAKRWYREWRCRWSSATADDYGKCYGLSWVTRAEL